MKMWMRALPLLLAGSVACSPAEAVRHPSLPARLLPPSIGELTVQEETKASAAYRTSYNVSLVADGKVFTLRRATKVIASLQVAVLKAPYRTTNETVARGIRSSIETGNYRWFKVEGQWVGEQRLQEIGLYLWYPPGGKMYEVLVTRPELGIPKDLLAAIITYQRRAA